MIYIAINTKAQKLSSQDWLIQRTNKKATVAESSDHKSITLENGLIRRTFRLYPNLACVDFTNVSSGEQLLRAVSPEATITLNGVEYNIGGLYGQTERGYLKTEWLDKFTAKESDFKYRSYEITTIQPYVFWKQGVKKWAANTKQPTGQMLTFIFKSNLPAMKDIVVRVNYELYDGIPLVCKWISISNQSNNKVVVDKVVNEILNIVEEESAVAGSTEEMKLPHGIYIESNYAFNNAMTARLSDQTTHWKTDSTYTSQVSYELKTPCLLEVYPPIGPGVELLQGKIFKSIRTNELLLDSYDRERNGLAQRMMYRKITPWATQNPIFMHLTTTDSIKVKAAIDQCAEVGYEAVILSFFSGLNMEDVSHKNIAYFKSLSDYAHSKGILLGGYSLFSSRRINDQEDVIDPKTGKADVHALYAHAPCLASNWGLQYLKNLKKFMSEANFDLFEHDGPYAGDVCASVKHPGHKGLADSQWAQMELQKDLYHWCAENSIFVNAPDWYFLDGTNKIGLGYREQNFSLPREQQIVLNRQNIYDGTWEKMPSMTWGFVPLTEYHGGGAAATLEPLSEHAYAYEVLMMQYYGAGVQACYRGPRLFDTDETKKLVTRVINWYKKYRLILNSQIIHLRRPDGRDWDGIMHVNPFGKEKGLIMLYNPRNEMITRDIKIPLYYTGLDHKAVIREKEGKRNSYKLDRERNVMINVCIPANGYTWFIIE